MKKTETLPPPPLSLPASWQPGALLPYQLAHKAQRKAIATGRKRHSGPVSHEQRLSPTQQSGLAAEKQAAEYLQAKGLIVFASNLRTKTGEIDLICRDADTLVFVEVRQRRSRAWGGAAASVTLKKQARIIRTAHTLLPDIARRFLYGHIPPCRFDVVALEPEGTHWLKHAFSI